MNKRWAMAVAAVVLLAGVACGHPEKSVVDQYFNAVNAKDTQTLSSFAAVNFDKKVDKWAIKNTISDEKKPAPLPDLVQKSKDADAAVAANTKAVRTWSLDAYSEIDAVREARKANKPVPPSWPPRPRSGTSSTPRTATSRRVSPPARRRWTARSARSHVPSVTSTT